MTRKFYKHKLLLDENAQNRMYFPLLNERFDLKHVVVDYKQGSIPDEAVYELARKEGRLLVTYNIKDFILLSKKVQIQESLVSPRNYLRNRLTENSQRFCIEAHRVVSMER
jgi:hypothetical protein